MSGSGWHYPGPNEMYHRTPVLWHTTKRGINLFLCSLCGIKNLGNPDGQFRCQITKLPIYTRLRDVHWCTAIEDTPRETENFFFSDKFLYRWFDFHLSHTVLFWCLIRSLVRSKTVFNLTYLNWMHNTEHVFVTRKSLVPTDQCGHLSLIFHLTNLKKSVLDPNARARDTFVLTAIIWFL